MRKEHQATRSRNTLKLLVIFCFIVGFAIIASLSYRLFVLIRDSKFHGDQAFVVAFTHRDDLDVIGVFPKEKSLTHFMVRGQGSSKEKQKVIGLIPNATVTLHEAFDASRPIAHYFSDAILHKGRVKAELSSYDLFRLWLTTQGVGAASMEKEEVRLPVSETNLDDLVQDLFIDKTLSDENKSVEVVNATGVPGLGKELERVLINLGGNVISVTNADSLQEHSLIQYYGEKTYTLERFQSLLQIPVQESAEHGLSDIIIVIGKDRAKGIRY